VVLLVQALFFADGGLTALGVNITLMGLVTVLAGWGVFRLVTRFAPGRGGVTAASFVAALLSVPASALVFTLMFWIGGTAPVEIGTVAAAMTGVHVLIGVGEGLITALTAGAVLAVRPDLVYGARGTARPLVRLGAEGTRTVTQEAPAARGGGLPFLLGGLGVTLLLAGVVSFFASPDPDGLEAVAEEQGFMERAADHLLGDFALADYGEVGGIPVGVAGVAGVALTLIAAGVIAYAARTRSRASVCAGVRLLGREP